MPLVARDADLTPIARKWIKTLLKLAVCGVAVWYLSAKVTLRDYVYLAADPDRKLILETPIPDPENPPLELDVRDPAGGPVRRVARAELATQTRGGRTRERIELGLVSIVRRADLGWVGAALLAFAPVTFIIAWRLRLLLTMQQIFLSFRDAVLLTFAGNFFNFAMPGTTGGDLYKAYHIARRTAKRTEGVTVVILDRVIGLVSFLLLAAAAIVISWRRQMIGEYGRWVGYLMLALFLAAALFFSRRVRKWIRYDERLARLPLGDKLRRVDETVFNLRAHRGQTLLALAATVVAHFILITCLYFLARALHIPSRGDFDAGELYLAILLATVVGYLFAAIPISIQGFGLLEAVFIRVLVVGAWCNESQMLALTLGARLIQVIWASPGVLVPWLGFARPPSDAPA